MWLTRLAEATNQTYAQVAKLEVLSKYIDVAHDRKHSIHVGHTATKDIGDMSNT